MLSYHLTSYHLTSYHLYPSWTQNLKHWSSCHWQYWISISRSSWQTVSFDTHSCWPPDASRLLLRSNLKPRRGKQDLTHLFGNNSLQTLREKQYGLRGIIFTDLFRFTSICQFFYSYFHLKCWSELFWFTWNFEL